MTEPLVEVVIVSAPGARELLRRCLRSLERNPLRGGAMTIWVVDNASADGTVEMVREQFPSVQLVALPGNTGFAAANNVVLRRARAPYVLLLNPDTEIMEGALDGALATLRAHDDAGVVGVRLVRPDGSFDHAAKRSFPTLLGAAGHFTGIGRRAAAAGALAQYRAPGVAEHALGEVDAVNGAFMLVRRAAFAQVGLLDECYGLYFEDLDWCFRVKGAITVIERGRARYRGLALNVAFHRGMGRFYRKFSGGSSVALDALVYATLAGKLLVSIARSTIARGALR